MIKEIIEMAKKAKQQMTTDVAKALWETYANIYRERWAKDLAKASQKEDWSAVHKVALEMLDFRFDFNRSNK